MIVAGRLTGLGPWRGERRAQDVRKERTNKNEDREIDGSNRGPN